MKTSEQKMIVATIYNKPTMSKAELRAEGDLALQAFLSKGGVIQVQTKTRKAPKSKMSGKSSRGYSGGTSGFAIGFPSKSL